MLWTVEGDNVELTDSITVAAKTQKQSIQQLSAAVTFDLYNHIIL